MRLVLLCISMCLAVITASAQNETEALRYSMQTPVGSARYLSMGGAFGALGGDLSALSDNPAGIGIFRRSEFSLSLGLNTHSSETQFGDNDPRTDGKGRINLPQIGIIGANPIDHPLWRRVNFAVTHNRLASFNETYISEGTQTNNSLLEVFAQQANGLTPDEIYDFLPFGAALAWDAFLINPIDTLGTLQYNSVNPFGDYNVRKQIERRGHMGETVVSVGGSYDDRFYIGANIGFPTINFREVSTYTESDLEPEHELDRFTYSEELNTNGRGVNFKLGVIYKITELLRFGAAWLSPSFLTVNDIYVADISATYRDGQVISIDGPQNNFEYRIRTPSKYTLNAAYILGKRGIISADYTYTDFSRAQLNRAFNSPSDYDFALENTAINDLYRGVHNVEVGIEVRVVPRFAVRAGASYQQSAYVPSVIEVDNDQLSGSFGFGYRKGNGYVDFGFRLDNFQDQFFHHTPQVVPVSTTDITRGQAVISVGFRY